MDAAQFRRCACVDAFGHRRVCVPPAAGFMCTRPALLLKMEIKLQRQKDAHDAMVHILITLVQNICECACMYVQILSVVSLNRISSLVISTLPFSFLLAIVAGASGHGSGRRHCEEDCGSLDKDRRRREIPQATGTAFLLEIL